MKKVYIVILNYNGWMDTIECLESVLSSNYLEYQILVVDNASSDNSMDHMLVWARGVDKKLKESGHQRDSLFTLLNREDVISKNIISHNKIVFLQSDINGGFAEGNNLAIRYALNQKDFEYIWLLNNDTVIREDSLSQLVSYSSQNDIGICGSTLFYYDNPQEIQAYGGHINRFFGTSRHIVDQNEICDKLDYVVGASFLIDKRVIDKIGLLPEDYFLYYEETDYCFNAKNNGFSLGIAVDSIVYHKEGASTGANRNTQYRSEFSDVLTLKNRIKFHRKYLGGGIGLWLGMLIAFFNRIRRKQISRIYKVFV